MQERKMATVRKISAIESIPEADRICTYVIDGWKVVDSIGKYKVGEKEWKTPALYIRKVACTGIE